MSAYHFILSTCYQFSEYKGHPNQIPICFYPQHHHSLISEPNIISTRVSSRFPTLNLIVTLHFKFESHNPICLDIILIQSQLPLYWLYFNSNLLSQISVKFVFNSNSLFLGVFKQFTLFKNQIFLFEIQHNLSFPKQIQNSISGSNSSLTTRK